jgi:acetolactate synthase-1/2/3 large subunit
VASGVDVCFTNPGTTELPIVAALDAVPGVRSVLGLFEGVVTGAADGYGRITGRPALTLLHLGPGFANGIANLHNARRARTPIVNLIGDHATWHVAADAPLTSDIVSLASPVSGWVRTAQTAAGLAGDLMDAVEASLAPPGCGATLIVPTDCQWDPAPKATKRKLEIAAPTAVTDDAVALAAKALGAPGAVLYVGGPALTERGLWAIARIEAATGASVFGETFPAKVDRGRHLPMVRSLPYFPERGAEALAGAPSLVLAGALAPVAFFAMPDGTSQLAPPGAEVIEFAPPGIDVIGALEALADHLGAPRTAAVEDREAPEAPTGSGALNADIVGQAVSALLPEHCIVVDEAATSSLGYVLRAPGGVPHTALGLTGGAIGQGLPVAVGAAVAAPDRKVVSLQADGSGMYTLQSLWTMAREGLDVAVVVLSNRKYAILQVELFRAGITQPGPTSQAVTDLSRPDLNWVALAQGLGVPATRPGTTDEFVAELQRALHEPGPSLIEAVI